MEEEPAKVCYPKLKQILLGTPAKTTTEAEWMSTRSSEGAEQTISSPGRDQSERSEQTETEQPTEGQTVFFGNRLRTVSGSFQVQAALIRSSSRL